MAIYWVIDLSRSTLRKDHSNYAQAVLLAAASQSQ